jgi:isochorismate synthase
VAVNARADRRASQANRADDAITESMARALRAALDSADRTGVGQLASVTVPIATGEPLAFFEVSAGGDRLYWSRPAAGVALAGRGVAAVVEAKGADRFEQVDRAVTETFARLHGDPAAGAAAPRPRFFGGFSFVDDPPPVAEWQAFPAARLVLPESLVSSDARGAWLIATRRIGPGAAIDHEMAAWSACVRTARSDAARVCHRPPEIHPDPGALGEEVGDGAEYAVRADRPHDVYRGQVAAALRAIGSGLLEKVVVARSLAVRHEGRFDVEAFLASLERIYPSCTTLAIGHGEDILVAATPELLVRRTGGRVDACAVAGSAPRGRSPAEDDALGAALAASPKERAEHDAVVRAVRSALADACGALAGPDHPELLRLEGIQHLSTPLAGRLRGGPAGPSAVDLAGRLHPTPAVGGLPREAARDWIARHEGLDRGWYASPVGFVDEAGDGEWWVALRSALIRTPAAHDVAPVSTARLFAGAGIVAGSDPEQELRETRLKLRALLAPLTEI